MKLSNLPKLKTRVRKRVGRGYSSGKGGHTVGRGQKGQKSRSGGKTKLAFEGGQLPFIKRVPHMRGFKRASGKVLAVNLTKLQGFKKGAVIDIKAIIEGGVVPCGWKEKIKILGSGDINVPLTIRMIQCSSSAEAKIIKAGGKVIG